MLAQNKKTLAASSLVQWIEADLALLEAYLNGETASPEEQDYLRQEAPLALENAKACVAELKKRTPLKSGAQ